MNNQETISVPCGKCPNCIKRRTSAWSFRLMQEDKRSKSSLFVTLTYDTMKVPITHNGYMTIVKRDLQLFFKRLRKAHVKENISIKYYAVGEYGGKTKRPHYHIILFNAKLSLISTAWNLGHVHYGTVSEASVGYTMKYIAKNGSIPMHRNDDRTPEFSLMSKGLGDNYITDKTKKWHKQDLTNRMYCNVGEKKISMPRYYKEKIYSESERKAISSSIKLKQSLEEQKNYETEGYYAEKAQDDLQSFRRQKHKNSSRDKL